MRAAVRATFGAELWVGTNLGIRVAIAVETGREAGATAVVGEGAGGVAAPGRATSLPERSPARCLK